MLASSVLITGYTAQPVAQSSPDPWQSTSSILLPDLQTLDLNDSINISAVADLPKSLSWDPLVKPAWADVPSTNTTETSSKSKKHVEFQDVDDTARKSESGNFIPMPNVFGDNKITVITCEGVRGTLFRHIEYRVISEVRITFYVRLLLET